MTKEKSPVKWKFKTGDRIDRSPTISNGVIYFGSGKNLYAVDIKSSEEKWSFETGSWFSFCAISEGIVYVGSGKNLYALDIKSGEEKWSFETGSWVYSCPVVSEGIVYFGSGKNLYALDIKSGEEKWKFEVIKYTEFGSISSSPNISRGMVYFGSDDNHLFALDVKTGELKWKFETEGNAYTQPTIKSSPTISEGMVYFGSDDNYLYALDVKTGEEQWKFKTGGYIESSPTISEGMVYFGSDDNYLYALDVKTGEEKWKFETRGSVKSSPIVFEGLVYFGSWDNHLYALDVKTGEEKWKFETRGSVQSSPIVFEGLVYFGSGDNYLYALDVKLAEKLIPEIEKELEEGLYTILADQQYCTEYVGDYMTVEEMAKALVESDGVDLPGNWHEYDGLYHYYGNYSLKDQVLLPDGTTKALNLELKTDITDCGGDFVISGTGDESGTVGDFVIELDHEFDSTKLKAMEEYGLVRGYEYDGIGFEGSPEGNPIEGDEYRFYGQSTTIQVKTSNGYEEFDLKKTISDMKGKGIDVSDSEAVLKYLKDTYGL